MGVARWGVALCLAAAACSSSDDGEGATPGASTTTTTVEEGPGNPCDLGATTDEVAATPVDGIESDLVVESFDGTEIRIHWFPTEAAADEPVPTVLLGSGWSQPGATLERDMIIGFGSSPIVPLLDAGYNVLTWDPRGFGESGGEANVDSPDFEGRDVQVLLDWVAEQPEALLDDEGDPRVGMSGASYGGGIQLVTAAIDCRVDAIVPAIAWNSLETSLYPAQIAKSGWGNLLATAVGAMGGTAAPEVAEAAGEGLVTGVIPDDLVDWFADRGPGDLVGSITAPTLLVHGTADNLFTPTEAVTNFRHLQEAGTTVAMVWFCGGHGICLADPGDGDVVQQRTLAWFDRHLKGDADADVGPVVDYIDQDGVRWTGDDHPGGPDATIVAASDGGTLVLSTASQAGPTLLPGGGSGTDSLFAGITPAAADVALELTATADDDALVLGIPRVEMTYSGTVPDGVAPTRVFAQIVDDETGLVLGNQIVPVPVVLDGDEHTVEVALELVVHHLRAGRSLTLQIVATTPAFATPRLGGELVVTDLRLELPVTQALDPSGA